jgi:mRNA-degrading endonuclease toxin of MazEF toxin-antitoxin module
MQCNQVTSIPRQRIQKHLRSHGNEPPEHNNSEERDNSIVEAGDLHTVRPQPTSGRELANRKQNITEDRTSQKWSLYLCGVVTV